MGVSWDIGQVLHRKNFYQLPFAPTPTPLVAILGPIDEVSGKLKHVSAIYIGVGSLSVTSQLKDHVYPLIVCSIYDYLIPQDLCDLRASVDIMPKAMLSRLNHPHLYPTLIRLQFAESAICIPKGIVRHTGEDIGQN